MKLEEKRALYREAMAFYELAECGRIHVPERQFVENYIPYIVNMTFCTELFLKLLLVHNGKTIDKVRKIGHNLYGLYESLTQPQKDEIYSLFKRPMIYSIPEEIKNISDAFTEWRYLVLNKANSQFEKILFKPCFIRELNEVLEKIGRNILNM